MSILTPIAFFSIDVKRIPFARSARVRNNVGRELVFRR